MPQLDALLGNHFAYNPAGQAHARLSAQHWTRAEVQDAARTARDVWAGCHVELPANGHLGVRSRFPLRTAWRAARLGLGCCVRRATPKLRPAFAAVDMLFGNVQGPHGCAVRGVLPQLGRLPFYAGALLGAAAGMAVGWALMPALAGADASFLGWTRQCAWAGAQVGAQVGAMPRWWLCQASGSVGLAVKLGLVSGLLAGWAMCKLAHALVTRGKIRIDAMPEIPGVLRVAPAHAKAAGAKPDSSSAPPSALFTELVLHSDATLEAHVALQPEAVLAQLAPNPTRRRDWGIAALLAGLYIGLGLGLGLV